MLVAAVKNSMLDTEFVNGDEISLHTAYSATGANEVTGGTYAKQAITWTAASAGVRAMAAAESFTGLPASTTIKWVGIWTTGGVFKGMVANGGTEKSFQVDLTNDKIYCEAHGYSDADTIVFTGTTLPTGLTAGTTYYVINSTAADPDTLQVSLTSGGAAINLTGSYPSADAKMSLIVEEIYTGAGGQHDIDTLTVTI